MADSEQPGFVQVNERLLGSWGQYCFKPLESRPALNYPARMKYPVILIPSDEGFAVSCPALPGCWSQGKTQPEALANIREAIQLWLDVAAEDARNEAGREAGTLTEVTV